MQEGSAPITAGAERLDFAIRLAESFVEKAAGFAPSAVGALIVLAFGLWAAGFAKRVARLVVQEASYQGSAPEEPDEDIPMQAGGAASG